MQIISTLFSRLLCLSRWSSHLSLSSVSAYLIYDHFPFSHCFHSVSAGFDAADGDELGECHVTPAGYAHMTHMLSALAGGKMVVALEVSTPLSVADF